MIEQQPCTQAAAGALEMEVWSLVAELAKPLYGHQPIPALIAQRIVVAHCLRHTAVSDETLGVFIGDLRAMLAQNPVLAN